MRPVVVLSQRGKSSLTGRRFEGVHFQHYNHKRYPLQPTKDEIEQTARVEFPPWKKRGSDLIWDLKIDIFEVFGYVDLEKKKLLQIWMRLEETLQDPF